MNQFEPRIIGFYCTWCAYKDATEAPEVRISEVKHPPNLRMIKLMCSGTIDPTFILEAFRKGADGVFIGSCHPGECHYKKSNLHTRRRVVALKSLLEALGINGNRLRLEWVSAAEGQRFAEAIADFIEEIKELGPSPLNRSDTQHE